ncbi:MAG: M14 family metallopeptidase [Winogradskyella sp.]|uniref:M14 family metallopeptidase n=1 Tax=Winogradskyella sp. TaxID=1883156 RepID=UPI0025E1C0FD|nr:M14 family metallopeptidase [Winogradskyella sp.]NRB83420.1 M14 family metallopeptidase [Winogradskyella sp.]
MKKLFILLLLISSCSDKSGNNSDATSEIDFTTVFEKSNGLETATYDETIQFYLNLSEEFDEISIREIGETDSGKPLHIVTLNMAGGSDDFDALRSNHRIMLINNGIHPGESDGIDATMMLYRDIVQGKIEAPKQTILVTIPIYNVGGSLNRNSGTRTNQNGPKEYGFRGNARNYDLNRDFIKSDTKNARTFAQIFHLVQPDVFIDNHVSNGADYQYILTHLFTQHNKLGGVLGDYLHTEIMPLLEKKLEDKSWDITPYVNVFNRTPESGFSQFMDSPRYSTGYTTLFNTLGMMVETHMLKPYKQRVEGTYELMKSMIEITEEQGGRITQIRRNQSKTWKQGSSYPLSWAIDTTQSSTLKFKGYEGFMIPSDLTGAQRLKYDRTKPYIKDVSYQNYFKPSSEVTIPKAYVIPQGWHNVIELLSLNQVELTQIKKDTLLNVESYRIEDYDTRPNAYEGHYLHYNTKVKSSEQKIKFRKGDYIISTDQKALRYLLETLEPTGPDSFFNWNFFDTILQQKEGFSPYIWEDRAKMVLRTNPKLQIEYNIKVSYDEEFANNWYAQLDWIHKKSNNYEKAHLQYPVYRLN